MNYAEIKTCDIANGTGVRTSLFVSGCRNACPGCFNACAWSFEYGRPFTKETAYEILNSVKPGYVQGISLLGGEPFEPENQPELTRFLKMFKAVYPQKTAWCYTGFTYEQLTGAEPCRAACDCTAEMLNYIDVLVDGPFLLEQKDISLKFRGSANQRVLDLAATRAAGCPVLWHDDPIYERRESL